MNVNIGQENVIIAVCIGQENVIKYTYIDQENVTLLNMGVF